MTRPTENLARDLFVAALDVPPAERARFVAARCDDPLLRAEVEALLASHERIGDFLQVGDGIHDALAGLAIRPGTRFADFEIVAYHAHGGRGIVYRARQLSLGGREVALKVVPLLRPAEGVDGARLRREAELAARVEHRHLVAIHGVGEAEGGGAAWYAMRFVRGPTLHDVLEHLAARGRSPSREERRTLVARIAEIAHAAGALHAAGLVHGDIKPSNVMLEDGTREAPWSTPAVLVDFGLARVVDAGAHSTIAATMAYAAPERLRGAPLEPRVDVFALGMTLWDLLRGELPERRAGHAPEFSPSLTTAGVDGALAAIVQRATCSAPARRHPDGESFALELDRWLADDTRGARRVRVVEELVRTLHREPRRLRRAAVKASLGIAIVLALGWAIAAANSFVAARAAWERGDFGSLAAMRARSPWLVGLATPIGESDVDLEDALLGDRGAGRLRAACRIDRDGPARHPTLVRFLAHEVREAGDEDDALFRLVALLALDHPAREPVETTAYGALAAELRARLGDATAPLCRAYAAAALGNLGDARDLALLLDAAKRCLVRVPRTAADLESGRVAIEAAAALLRVTSARERTVPTFHAAELVRAVDGGDPATDARTAWSSALERLTVEWAFAVRRAGRDPGQAGGLGFLARSASVRAAFADRVALDALIALGPELRGIDTKDAVVRDVQRAWNCLHYGRLVGAQSTALPEARVVVERAAREAGFDPDRATALFDRGAELARRHAAGELAEDEPDHDTRLRHLLESERRTRPECVLGPLATRSLIYAEFTTRPILVPGPASGLVLRDVTIEDDEVASQAGYAKLALPGRSSIEIEFAYEHVIEDPVWLLLTVQKGARRRLPHHGHAVVDVFLDGVCVLPGLATPSSASGSLDLPLVQRLDRGTHRLEVRLGSDADTTLRVSKVALYQR